MNLLEVKGLTKKYGDKLALDGFSFKVPKNSVFGLLGPNGAGKTTLIRILNQITQPDSGEINLDGRPLKPKDVELIGYLPEERGLYKSMKVAEQIIYLAQLKGLSKKDAKKRMHYWFDRLNIKGWGDKKIEELSKGMAQKIQFIVTVIHNPPLLILDEPFSGFDPVNANLIKNEILTLKEEGATIILSTHRMENVEELCDNIALIHKSKKVLDGSVRTIKNNYRTQTYEVGFQSERAEEITRQLSGNFTVQPAYFKDITAQAKLQVKLNDHQSTTSLLKFLIDTKVEITHFSELVPSINDIFIKTVEQHG
ncbi:ABC transporter ATP-binding protein [Mesonia sediminis]|uniref:ABC transporter ATP-binding protein n=1 Tax=Mesonia sediminis TaxID=1703946 RepID=A0ABW5SGP7_9FLAO